MQHSFALRNAAGGEALVWEVQQEGAMLPAHPVARSGSV